MRPHNRIHSRKLEPPRHKPLKHRVRIIPSPHHPELLHTLRAIMRNNPLVITSVIHELIPHIIPMPSGGIFNPRMDAPRGIVGFLVSVREPVSHVEDEPSLIDGLEAQGIGAAGIAREDGARGNGLDAQG